MLVLPTLHIMRELEWEKKRNNNGMGRLMIVLVPARNTSKASRTVLVEWRACCDSQVRYVFPICWDSYLHGWICSSCALTPSRSGLLGEDDGATDLGTLEKKLAEKKQESRQASQAAISNPTSPSLATSAQEGVASTPRSSLTSPEPPKEAKEAEEKRKSVDGGRPPESEEEVEALSEMMCSLVTNTSGETRYIGTSPRVLNPPSSLS